MGNWRESIQKLHGDVGVALVEDALAFGPSTVKAGYPVVLPPFTLGLIASLVKLLGMKDEPELVVSEPVQLDTIWNKTAKFPFPRRTRELGNIEQITVHHSGTTPRDQTSIAAWHAYHTVTKSWSNIGYHFAIASVTAMTDGGVMFLYQMNDMRQVTWHDSSNYKTLGIVFAGDLRAGKDGEPNQLQLDLWGQLTAWIIPQLSGLKAIAPHSSIQATACPGDWSRWLPKLVQASADQGQDISDLVQYTPTRKRDAGFSVFSTPEDRELQEAQKDV